MAMQSVLSDVCWWWRLKELDRGDAHRRLLRLCQRGYGEFLYVLWRCSS